jgi:GntR family transcriptional regulator
MLFRLDSESGMPFYQQIVRQAKLMIAGGRLQPGDRLPTVRELAAQLVVNPNTVARAYLDLEREGVVETRRGQGTFACAPANRIADAERQRIITDLLKHVLVEAYRLNMSSAEVREALDVLISERDAIAAPLAAAGAEPGGKP